MVQRIKDKIFEISQKWGKKIGLDLPYFVKNGFWVGMQQTIAIIAGFAVAITFARVVPKEIFGQYQLVISIFSTISILSLPGLNIALSRSVARGCDGDYKKIVKTSFRWSLIAIPVMLLIGTYFYFFKEKIIGTTLIISSVFIPFFYAPNSWSGFLMGKSRFNLHFKYSFIQSIINVLAIIGAITINKENLVLIVLAYLISFSFLNCIFYIKSLRMISNNQSEGDTIKYGLFLTFSNLIDLISENIDKIIIGVMLSSSDLAIYSIVSIVPLKLRSIMKPLINITFPKMSLDKVNPKESFNKNKKILFVILSIFLASSIIYYYLIEPVSKLFFGQNYNDYYFYSKYFLIFFLVSVPTVFLLGYLNAKKENKKILLTGPYFFVFKSVVTIFSVYFFGLLGGIIAFNMLALVRFIFLLLIL